MKRTNIITSWARCAAWMAGVLLTGLLLSSCGPAGVPPSVDPCATPIAINDQAGLEAIIANNPKCSYFLTKNITLTGNWVPLDTFTGKLDGRGYTISGLKISDLDIDSSSGNYMGFFRELGADAEVKDLIFDAPQITLTKGTHSGFLAETSKGKIQNVKITGEALITFSLSERGGGFGAIVNTNEGTIKNVGVENIKADIYVQSGNYIGGLVGSNGGTIENSYVGGTLESRQNDYSDLAGFAGQNSGTIKNSYSKTNVTGERSVAGFVILNNNGSKIENSYAVGAVSATGDKSGFVRSNFVAEIINSYFDKATTNQTDGIRFGDTNNQTVTGVIKAANIELNANNGKYYDNGGTPGTTTTEIFVGWDFTDIWVFAQGAWPTLKWQKP